ncbi:MAG: DMT family transporter [Ectothiorhodospira sp.]
MSLEPSPRPVPTRDGHGLAVAALLVGATLWGFFWYPLRALETAGLPGLWAVAFIYLGATLVGLVAARHHLAWLRRAPLRVAGIALTSGLSGTAFSLGMIHGEVARVMLFFYLSPVWSVLMARLFLDETFTRASVTALLLALGGAVVMLWPGQAALQILPADLLGLIAGMAFAATNIQVRHARWLPLRIKTLAAWAGAPFLAAGSAGVLGMALVPDPRSIALALLVGMVMMTAMTVTVQIGVTRLPVRQSSVILIFELVAGALSAAWLAGELLEIREWIGGALIVCGGMIAGWRRRGH